MKTVHVSHLMMTEDEIGGKVALSENYAPDLYHFDGAGYFRLREL